MKSHISQVLEELERGIRNNSRPKPWVMNLRGRKNFTVGVLILSHVFEEDFILYNLRVTASSTKLAMQIISVLYIYLLFIYLFVSHYPNIHSKQLLKNRLLESGGNGKNC